jgi:hypothetical protein
MSWRVLGFFENLCTGTFVKYVPFAGLWTFVVLWCAALAWQMRGRVRVWIAQGTPEGWMLCAASLLTGGRVLLAFARPGVAEPGDTWVWVYAAASALYLAIKAVRVRQYGSQKEELR